MSTIEPRQFRRGENGGQIMSMSVWLPAAIGLLVAVVAFVICAERAYDAGYEQGFLHGRAAG